MRNVMIVFGLLAVLTISLITGCSKSEGEKKKDLVGVYINEDDPKEYFVLKEDGAYRYYHEKLGLEMTGQWEVEGNKLIVSYPTTGPMPPSMIKSNKIIGKDGSIYIKTKAKTKSHVSLKPASIVSGKKITKKKTTLGKKTSKDSIAGRYIVEVVKKDGTIEKAPGIIVLKENGKVILRTPDSKEFVIPDQKWEFKDGAVQIYQHAIDGWSEPLSGKLKGNTIIFKMRDSELRYVKQSDHSLFSVLTTLPKSEGKLETKLEREAKSKTFYDLIKEDDKRLRAEMFKGSKFKKLSPKDKIQAKRLFEMALTEKKIERLPGMTYKRMVDYCKEIIKKYPKSLYAAKARRMLGDIPEKDRKQYSVTEEEINLSD